MPNRLLADLSFEYAVEVSKIVMVLNEHHEFQLSRQFGRCSTSIGANVREAHYAQSKADFISKLSIALKEAHESDYWADILFKLNLIDDNQYNYVKSTCNQIRMKLIKSVRTAKKNLMVSQ